MKNYFVNWDVLEDASRRLAEMSRQTQCICDNIHCASDEIKPVYNENEHIAVISKRIIQALTEQTSKIKKLSETVFAVGEIYYRAEREACRLSGELPGGTRQTDFSQFVVMPNYGASTSNSAQDDLVMLDWLRELARGQQGTVSEPVVLTEDDFAK